MAGFRRDYSLIYSPYIWGETDANTYYKGATSIDFDISHNYMQTSYYVECMLVFINPSTGAKVVDTKTGFVSYGNHFTPKFYLYNKLPGQYYVRAKFYRDQPPYKRTLKYDMRTGAFRVYR